MWTPLNYTRKNSPNALNISNFHQSVFYCGGRNLKDNSKRGKIKTKLYALKEVSENICCNVSGLNL